MLRAAKIFGLLLALTAAALCEQAGASKPPKTAKPPAAAKVPSNPEREARTGNPAAPRINVPLNPVQRILRMTPEEQERVLERLPPQDQVRFRAAIDRFNQLPPQARARMLRQAESLSSLPLPTQSLLRRQMNAFNRLPDDRRLPVRRELVQLLKMPQSERMARLGSDDFKTGYSPEEQQILTDLSTNLPPDYLMAGR